ncbi:MAG: hypothetical protein JNL97_07405 [Verrucomicrobiales bacterium]|nr:hypothetical protein [Verrucomicrobiales bacterium]
MIVWFPEEIRYDLSIGTVEIVCPGCRERVVADVHERSKGAGRVGRCRVCGFFGALPEGMVMAGASGGRFLAKGAEVPQVAPFVALAGSAHEIHRSGGGFEFTKERALLAAVAIALKWHRPRVFRTRTLFCIAGAVVLGSVLVAASIEMGVPWVAFLAMGGLFVGVLMLHRALVRRRAQAEVGERVTRFSEHFGVPVERLVEVGRKDGGDFGEAARFLRMCMGESPRSSR